MDRPEDSAAELERQAAEARERLAADVDQVATEVRERAGQVVRRLDWRGQVRAHPWAAVGLAAALGFLLAR